MVKPLTEEEKMDDEGQHKYRSGVASLLYLLKYSRLDLSNAVRELSKIMDSANKGHMKALLRAIKFVEQTKEFQLVMAENENSDEDFWELKAYSDLDYAGNAEDRRSISGYILYLNGCLWARLRKRKDNKDRK